jgi:hypothetical protein
MFTKMSWLKNHNYEEIRHFVSAPGQMILSLFRKHNPEGDCLFDLDFSVEIIHSVKTRNRLRIRSNAMEWQPMSLQNQLRWPYQSIDGLALGQAKYPKTRSDLVLLGPVDPLATVLSLGLYQNCVLHQLVGPWRQTVLNTNGRHLS